MTVLIGSRYSDLVLLELFPRPVILRRLALIWQFQSSGLVEGGLKVVWLYGPRYTQQIKLAYPSDRNKQNKSGKKEKKLVGWNPGGFLSLEHWTAEQNEWNRHENPVW